MSTYVIQVSAGTGPVEVRRFVASLADRFEALCEARGLPVQEVAVRGDESEPRSVEIVVRGDAPAVLAGEAGTHALVARSRDRGRAARKRWFAGVSIHPLVERSAAAAIDPRDVEITATTAGGPGGQHVNKTSTAVRVRHVPSGITLRVADERSQRANLKRALERLAARLAEIEADRAEDGGAARRLAHYRVERGAPVRTYELRPRGELQEQANE